MVIFVRSYVEYLRLHKQDTKIKLSENMMLSNICFYRKYFPVNFFINDLDYHLKELQTQVQNLNKAVCISLFANGKGVNLSVLPPAMSK